MSEIFEQLYFTSINLLNEFIDEFPSIVWKQWPEEDIVRVPWKPEDSKLDKNNLLKMST
jgi:hypothetical protein